MSNANDVEFIAAALEILSPPPTGMGIKGTFTHDPRVVDPTTRKLGAGAVVPYTNKTCSPLLPYRANQIDGKDIVVGDSFVYVLAGQGFAPTKDGWTATVNGLTLKVVGVATYFSGEDACVYEVQLRNG